MTRKRFMSDNESPVKRRKSARTTLDFKQLENTPPKRRKLVVAAESPRSQSSADSDEQESFTIKSFYGKREKKNFPHSPGRRKAANQVLSKISDNSQSSPEVTVTKVKDLDIVSPKGTRIRRRISASLLTPKSTTADVNKNLTPNKEAAITTNGKAPEEEHTPAVKKNKFFKHKSPASAEKALGSLIIRKGFDVKFVPRGRSCEKLMLDKKKKRERTPSQSKKPKSKSTPAALKNGKGTVKTESSSLSSSSVLDNDASQDLFGSDPSQETFSQDPCPSSLNSDSLFSSEVENADNASTISTNALNSSLSKSSIGSPASSLSGASLTSGPSRRKSPRKNSNPREKKDADLNSNEMQTSDAVSSPGGSSKESPTKKDNADAKYFSIFTGKSPQSSPLSMTTRSKLRSDSKGSPRSSPRVRTLKMDKCKKEQMILDAGQKKIGAMPCEICGMVYHIGDPGDELMHSKFHQHLKSSLKFPGWKKERVVQEYPDLGSRVLMVMAEDPKYAIKKLEEINSLMGQEMGFPDTNFKLGWGCKAFLYITDDKTVGGCCFAEPIQKGYRVIADSQASQPSQPGHRPMCCRDKPEHASVGISRIWVHNVYRRQGVATKLLDCVRQNFVYGSVINKSKLAFSDPTPDGKQLAVRYLSTPEFLVYKYQ